MKTILVSGASGLVGYGTLKSLKSSGKDLLLIGTSIYNDSVAGGFCDIFEEAIPTSNENYLEWLNSVIKKYNVDLIIPGIEEDLYKWSSNREIIENSGAKILTNNINLIQLCKDKWAFYNDLKKKNSPYLIPTSLDTDYHQIVEKFGLPFLLKPKRGFASKGIIKINNEADFNLQKSQIGEILMVQQIVGNDEEEFTTSAFCDGKGSYYATMTLRRKLSKDGYTNQAETYIVEQMDEVLHHLCAHLMPIGPTNFQFRKHNGELKLLEINPRISSSTSIRAAFGYNESGMAVEYYLENKVPIQPSIRSGKAVRYIEDKIFFDDRNNI